MRWDTLIKLLVVIATAILVQAATVLATLDVSAVDDWRQWLIGVLVGIANAVGLAVLAWRGQPISRG